MRSGFDELKRFAIADVLSVSGKEKTTSTIEKHIDNIIDVAIAREQNQQSKIDELQKQVDAAKQLIEDLNKCYQQDHQNKFEYWRGFADSAGILGKRLEQALKGEAHG